MDSMVSEAAKFYFVYIHPFSLFVLAAIGGIIIASLFQGKINSLLANILNRLNFTRANLNGIWISEYVYESDYHNKGVHSSGHYVIIKQYGDKITIKSIKQPSGSRLFMALNLDAAILSGTWKEQTSKHTQYYGVLHMVVAPNKDIIYGGWMGFDNRNNIQTGPWVLRFIQLGSRKKDIKKFENAEPEVKLDASNPPFPTHQYELPERFLRHE